MDFAQYVGVCLPVGLVVFVLWFLVIKYVLKMDVSRLANIDYDALNKDSNRLQNRKKLQQSSVCHLYYPSGYFRVYLVCISCISTNSLKD